MTEIYTLYFLLPMAFAIGICFGSFVTMASHRLPLGEDIVFKSSYCPQCQSPLTFFNLVPLFSWMFQRRRCSRCKSPIHFRYPLIEFSLGVTFAALVYFYGLHANTLFFAFLAMELAILIVTDLEHFIIPDFVQVMLFITGIAYRLYHADAVLEIALDIAVGLSIGLLLHYGYYYLRKKDGLGFGDVKFLAVAGAWLPLIAFVPFFFFAGLIGTVTGLLWRYKKGDAIFPFGPALACSLFINVLFPDIIARITL